MNKPTQSEALGCRVLLLEIIRRAAYDWVLYRGSKKLEQRKLARDAYVWLFVEAPGHADWQERERDGDSLFSFLNICLVLDLDPAEVRMHLRALTARDIKTVGRPPTRRRLPVARSDSDYIDVIDLDIGKQRGEVVALLEAGDLISLE